MNVDYFFEKTLYDMLKKDNIEDIRTKDIISSVGSCKATFYKYYIDKYDLLVKCMNRFIYKDIMSCVTFKEFIPALMSALSSDPVVVLHAFSSNDVCSGRFYNDKLIFNFISKMYPDEEKRNDPVVLTAMMSYSHDITGILHDWIQNGCTQPQENLMKIIEGLKPAVFTRGGVL